MTDRLQQKILIDGLDDWVPRAAIQGAARLLGATSREEEIAQSRRAVRTLVEAGRVEIGVVDENGFMPWDGTVREIVERLEDEWQTQNEFAFWTRNTDAGVQAARRGMS